MRKTLHLNLKRKWFDMILSGEKKEEYREIKKHWVKQLLDFKPFYYYFKGDTKEDRLAAHERGYSELIKNIKNGTYVGYQHKNLVSSGIDGKNLYITGDHKNGRVNLHWNGSGANGNKARSKDINTITFSNGYKKDRPQFEIELKSIKIDTGKTEWGAEENEKYFVLELGEILNRGNCE
jgi:hypothetical protein